MKPEQTGGDSRARRPNAKMRTQPSFHLSLSWIEKPSPPSHHTVMQLFKSTKLLPFQSFVLFINFSASFYVLEF